MKRTVRRVTVISLLVLAFFCLVAVAWYLTVKRNTYKPDPIRPKDFPDILIAPKNAVLIDHATPSKSQCAPYIYHLCFVVEDPYPSEETHSFIEEHLRSHGWQRLKYHLLNPDVPASRTPMLGIEWPQTVPESLDPESVDMLLAKGEQKGDYPVRYIMEDWVSENDQHVGVMLYYRADLATKKVHRDKVYVNLTLFERESWILPYIVSYRQLHPEEFQDSNDL